MSRLWCSRCCCLILVLCLGVSFAGAFLGQAKGWVAAFFILGVLILGHELGHFIAAKLIGVRVEVFSIGLGPRMIRLFKIGDTEVVVAWFFLFGGYVRMAGGDLGEEGAQEGEGEFFSKSPLQRVFVFAAGPGSNFLLALVLYAALYMVGSYEPVHLQMTLVGDVEKDSPAERAGLQRDDRVISVQGASVDTWQELQVAILESDAEGLVLDVDRFGQRRSVTIPRPNTLRIEGRRIGILPSDRVIVGRVRKDSPAMAAGIQPKDIVLSANGQDVATYGELKAWVEKIGEGGDLQLTLYRQGQWMDVNLRPRMHAYESEEPRPLIGIEGFYFTKLGFGAAWMQGARDVKATAWQFFRVLRQLLTRSLSPKNLSGPISVVKMTRDVAQDTGLGGLLQFAAFISVNLAMINLLPLVITDGGLILLAVVEALRRAPLSIKARERYAQFGIAVLILLMALAFTNDIVNLMGGREEKSSMPAKEASRSEEVERAEPKPGDAQDGEDEEKTGDMLPDEVAE